MPPAQGRATGFSVFARLPCPGAFSAYLLVHRVPESHLASLVMEAHIYRRMQGTPIIVIVLVEVDALCKDQRHDNMSHASQ